MVFAEGGRESHVDVLIDFTFENFRSFRDEGRLSMEPTHLVGRPEVDERVIFTAPNGRRLLKTAVICGANASGKSNVVKAMEAFRALVRRDVGTTGAPLFADPFRLTVKTAAAPSSFEVRLLIEGVEHRYGFRVTDAEVLEEWLTWVPRKREAELFRRRGAEIQLASRFAEGEGLTGRTRPDALFLTVASAFNGPVATAVRRAVSDILPLADIHDNAEIRRIAASIGGAAFRGVPTYARYVPFLRNVLRHGDVGVEDFRVRDAEGDGEQSRGGTASEVIETVHRVLDEHGAPAGEVRFRLDREESSGTRKLFEIAGIVAATLDQGLTLIIDELDARLHPLLTRKIIELFHTAETNPKNAQLIFATHDTNLLTSELFRRDQVWFVEKGSDGASELYSLAEIKGVRDDEAWERRYLGGRYGAVPILNRFGQGVGGSGA